MECRYDGGDCCPCDCSSSNHQCGSYGYNCKDHQSDCKYQDCHDKGGIVERIGDGACDDGPDGQLSAEILDIECFWTLSLGVS